MKELTKQGKTVLSLVIVVLSMAVTTFAQTWVPKGNIPANAVQGGQENGTPLYVCRGRHEGGTHSGKIVAGNCNIGYGGSEVVLSDYEMLVGNGTWGAARSGYAGAFVAGQESGQNLYLCRANYNGTHSGKVIGNNCNIGYGGEEKAISSFDVFYPSSTGVGSTLSITITTGGDDLRGGSWANFAVKLRGRPLQQFEAFFGRGGLGGGSIRSVDLFVPELTNENQIEYFQLVHVSHEDFGQTADNWDMNDVKIVRRINRRTCVEIAEHGPYRFTGSTRTLTFNPYRD